MYNNNAGATDNGLLPHRKEIIALQWKAMRRLSLFVVVNVDHKLNQRQHKGTEQEKISQC